MNRDAITASLVAACLPSELALLGYIDALGPCDAIALGIAVSVPTAVARQTAEALVARGLLVLMWPGDRRPPAYALAGNHHHHERSS